MNGSELTINNLQKIINKRAEDKLDAELSKINKFLVSNKLLRDVEVTITVNKEGGEILLERKNLLSRFFLSKTRCATFYSIMCYHTRPDYF